MFDENSNAAAATTVAASSLQAPNANIVTQLFNVKDSRWLQVEVCREFLRGQCARSDQECKFAHPPPNVDVQQGRVTACYDSIKGRCTRENPKCKYLHPPQHIKDQLLINGRNHLALKNLLSAQLNTGGTQPIVNPMAAQIAMQQQAAAAVNMIPNGPLYPYYQGLVYNAPVLQDPYAAAVNQLQAAALLGNIGGLFTAQAAAAAAAAASSTSSVAPSQQLTPLLSTMSRKRGLEDDPPSAIDAAHNQLQLLAAGGVPCKRPTMDKNGTVLYQAAAQPPQNYNPYLLQSLPGYVPSSVVSYRLVTRQTGPRFAATAAPASQFQTLIQPLPIKLSITTIL
ncbi:unnamed protein product [Caenorhabditis bovis]|uniref:Muscleblind-like protein n=1 Tax=Caenorhabditis bovis TaxID=2654633 RepID=A0A8S1EKA3_9PELO|nr:unnamed protein product [Caenorhabditis bovis]